jgi:hypothetical protein
MAYIKTKIPYGINTVNIGNVAVTTINIRVKNTFPVESIPNAVNWLMVNSKTGKEYYQLTYTAVDNNASRHVISEIGFLLRKHAQVQLDEKYAWVDSVFI